MPAMSSVEVIVLGLIIAAFAAFGATLLGVSLWVTLGKPAHAEIPREATQAKRVASSAHP